MFLGVRVKKGSGKNNTKAAILKTHSMKGFENETVKSLQYFGAHPVSKFSVGKENLFGIHCMHRFAELKSFFRNGKSYLINLGPKK